MLFDNLISALFGGLTCTGRSSFTGLFDDAAEQSLVPVE
jgi:hypothetical protein